MIAPEPPHTLAAPPPATTAAAAAAPTDSRASLRLRSLGWALLAGTCAGLVSLPLGPEVAVRSTGCGLFYGLLAFHLERVDPSVGGAWLLLHRLASNSPNHRAQASGLNNSCSGASSRRLSTPYTGSPSRRYSARRWIRLRWATTQDSWLPSTQLQGPTPHL